MAVDFQFMHRLHHKGWFAQMIQGWQVEAPETHLLETHGDLAAFTNPADWVLKPAYSRFANRTLLRPRPQQLRAIQPTHEQPWVAQRFAAGREHCSFSLLVEGRLTAHACYHPRYRVGRGSGIWFEPTDPPTIRAFLERFGAENGYRGVKSNGTKTYAKTILALMTCLLCPPRSYENEMSILRGGGSDT